MDKQISCLFNAITKFMYYNISYLDYIIIDQAIS